MVLCKAHVSIPPDPHYFTSHTALPQTLLCQLLALLCLCFDYLPSLQTEYMLLEGKCFFSG